MVQRLAIRPLVRLQGESILSCVEHLCFYGLCHERSINRDILSYLYHGQREHIAEEMVKCTHLHAALRNMFNKLRTGHGFEEYRRLSSMIKEVMQVETNADEATSRRIYATPCYSLAVCTYESGVEIPARTGRDPAQRSLQAHLVNGWEGTSSLYGVSIMYIYIYYILYVYGQFVMQYGEIFTWMIIPQSG